MKNILRKLLALIRLIIFALFSILIGISQLIVGFVFKDFQTLPSLFHRGVCFILNVKVRVTGADQLSPRHKFFVSNHLSWADIFVIGAHLEGVFVAKADVSKWPFLGQLSYLQRTIFIERTRAGVGAGLAAIKQALSRGDNIFLFPEGTNGYKINETLPFKSSYYSLFEDEKDLVIQPLAIKPLMLEGKKIQSQDAFEVYAWGEKGFVSHLLDFLGHWSQEIELKICAPIDVENKTRKELCLESQAIIERAIQHSA